MLKEQAKTEALRQWLALPKDQRRTEEQAAQFAMKLAMSDDLRFKASGDRYQHINGWLQSTLNYP